VGFLIFAVDASGGMGVFVPATLLVTMAMSTAFLTAAWSVFGPGSYIKRLLLSDYSGRTWWHFSLGWDTWLVEYSSIISLMAMTTSSEQCYLCWRESQRSRWRPSFRFGSSCSFSAGNLYSSRYIRFHVSVCTWFRVAADGYKYYAGIDIFRSNEFI